MIIGIAARFTTTVPPHAQELKNEFLRSRLLNKGRIGTSLLLHEFVYEPDPLKTAESVLDKIFKSSQRFQCSM